MKSKPMWEISNDDEKLELGGGGGELVFGTLGGDWQ